MKTKQANVEKKQSASCNAATIVIPMESSETLPEASMDAQGEDEEEDD